MERFEFDSKTGPNSNRREGSTRRGAIEIYPDFQPDIRPGLLSLDIRGPAGAYRGSAMIDKATAGKLGAALLTWAMPDNKALRAHLGDVLAAYEVVASLPRLNWQDNKKAAMAAAIEARKNGEWDHPALVAVGPLMPDEAADIAEIKRFYAD